MIPEEAVVTSILVLLAGGAVTPFMSSARRAAAWVTFFAIATTAVLVAVAVGTVLLHGPTPGPVAFLVAPGLGALRFHVDGLSCVFLVLTAVVAVPAALHSVGWVQDRERLGAGRYHSCLLLFVGAMYGLVGTTDTLGFLFLFWQLVALPGWALIRCGEFEGESARAARTYLVWMELACAAAMAGAAVLAFAGGGDAPPGLEHDFATFAARAPVLLASRPGVVALALALFLLAFGIKMGMWPFGQLWLPQAHSAAPSPVSALLSGVMIKSGVYGLIRCFLWLLPPGPGGGGAMASWGCAVAVLGTITLFTGTAQALLQQQSKRLLAFHSIGQIGYILLGTGACMVGLAGGDPILAPLAALGLAGALFHALNHGLFKSLLFLDAGAILHATGTRDLDRLGGLARHMPVTAATALVGALAISGVPLLNGFVSKWAVYVSVVLESPSAPYLAVCAVVAIATSALTLASFVKFFGSSFLSRASALVKERAAAGRLEVPWKMQVPQVFLAGACLLLGLAPSPAWHLVARALDGTPQAFGPAGARASAGPWTGVEASGAVALFAPLALLVLLALLLGVAHALSRAGGGARRGDEPWLCGYARESDCNRYSAHHLYGEVRRWLAPFGRAPEPQHPGPRGRSGGG